MTTRAPSSYLDHYLEPLRPVLERPEVTDIFVNRPGEIWVEAIGGAMERLQDSSLDEALLWRMARQIASRSHQGISRRHPLLAANLPNGARVQVVAPPATRGDMAIAIRRHAAASLSLGAYAHQARAGSTSMQDETLIRLLAQREHPEFLAEAVRRRLNIVISGGTSAGKTTLLNSLLAEIPDTERLIFIEDTPELRLSHPNSVGLVAARGEEGEAKVDTNDLLQAALRMRPDRIVLGELRGSEAFTFLRAINTGHPGSMTTVHADSPDRALIQLSMMALQAGLGIAYTELHQIICDMVDVVVQVERRDGRRVIAEIMCRVGLHHATRSRVAT